MDSDIEVAVHPDLFKEPEGFYQPQREATYAKHTLQSGQTLTMRLVGHSPLWGHLLWNAGRTVAKYLEDNQHALIKDKNILELGAGAGLPSLTCAILGAQQVVVTDYPDPNLITNLKDNIHSCELLETKHHIVAEGFIWGAPTPPLTRHLRPSDQGFDLLILADLLFNHTEHQKLVSTIMSTLKRGPNARALVFFTPYRPWLYEKDMEFFDLARSKGLTVTHVLRHVMEEVMFEDDPGDELLRKTVFGYTLSWEGE